MRFYPYSEKRDLLHILTMKSGIYFSSWSVYERKHFAIDIPTSHITHLFYAFFYIDTTTGKVKFGDEWCDIQLPLPSPKDPSRKVVGNLQQIFELKQLNRLMKVLMSVGGWGTEKQFESIIDDEAKLNTFVTSVGEFIKEYGFDGVDIDWEYPKDRHQNDRFVELLRRLRLEIEHIDKRLLLTIALPTGDEQMNVLNLTEINKHISFFNVMCYDFVGQGWATKTGYHSNLFGNNGANSLNASDVLTRYRKEVPSEKLVLGMPTYGRQFHDVSPPPSIGKPFTKKEGEENEIITYNILPVGTETVDSRKVSAFSYDGHKFISYDNPQTVRIKAQYVQLNKFGGGMWWDSAGDSKDENRSLVKNFVDQVGGVGALDKTNNILDIYGDSEYLRDVL